MNYKITYVNQAIIDSAEDITGWFTFPGEMTIVVWEEYIAIKIHVYCKTSWMLPVDSDLLETVTYSSLQVHIESISVFQLWNRYEEGDSHTQYTDKVSYSLMKRKHQHHTIFKIFRSRNEFETYLDSDFHSIRLVFWRHALRFFLTD